DMRRHFGVLMRGAEPEGGQWNFDKENRKSPPRGLKGPRRRHHSPPGTDRQ
ncbi:MAG: cryptochrome/photolyase family protein, partial [Rhizobium sp.]|nr:cryptochrome/photolyase family protein [Rhizobium sp.]